MQFPIHELTTALLSSYSRHGGINRLDGANLPAKHAVVEITQDLLRLVFPGFFEGSVIHSSELQAETALRIDQVAGRLEDEILKSIRCFDCPQSTASDPRKEAHDLTLDFLRQIPAIRAVLQTDIEAAFQGDPAAKTREEIIVAYPFVEAIAVHRLAHELHTRGVPLLPRIMSEWAHGRTGTDIHPGASIGSHFFLDHGTGTVIGETCVIGHHVKMFHGVTLGATSTSGGQALKGRKRHPTIENHVTIYSGAVILGGETVIGEGSTVGGNVFLMQSVPPNSVVLMEDVRVKVMSKKQRSSPGTTVLDFQV